jgi:hypothetical protein
VDPDSLTYVPALQSTQVLEPVLREYVPAPQLTHADAPANEYVPTPQYLQALATVAPVMLEYLPAPQKTQVLELLAPFACECVPAPQSTHLVTPLTVEYVPAVQ